LDQRSLVPIFKGPSAVAICFYTVLKAINGCLKERGRCVPTCAIQIERSGGVLLV
jgi:hypothetical protein